MGSFDVLLVGAFDHGVDRLDVVAVAGEPWQGAAARKATPRDSVFGSYDAWMKDLFDAEAMYDDDYLYFLAHAGDPADDPGCF